MWSAFLRDGDSRLGHPVRAELLRPALQALRSLSRSAGEQVLLNGDFHRGNVFAGVRGSSLAIDPCPCVGDPEFDLADFAADLMDPFVGEASSTARLKYLQKAVTERLDLDIQRVRDWMLAKRVVQAMENVAVHGEADWDLLFAQLLV